MDIGTQYGLEPTIVFAIDFTEILDLAILAASPSPQQIAAHGGQTGNAIRFWSDKIIYQSDGKTILFPGKIMEMSSINSAVGFDGNSASSDVTVVIDDSDLSILGLLGVYNIQKVPAYIYIYLPGMSPGSMIPVFEGIIVSGFKWSDKTKTATFTVLNTVIEKEVGFSPEQGYISNLPLALIGKPWPFGYGTIIKYPAIQINYSPVAITTAPFGIVDWSLNNENTRLDNLKNLLQGIALLIFESALGAYFSGLQDLGDQLTDEGNAALIQAQTVQINQLSIQDILAAQLVYQQDQTVITNVPISLKGVFSIGDTVLCQGQLTIGGGGGGLGSGDTGPASGRASIGNTSGVGNFHYIGPYFPAGGTFFLPNYSPAQVQPFYFIQAGTLLKYLGPLPDAYTDNSFNPQPLHISPSYPLRFVVNCLGGTINEVYAYKTVEGSHRLTNVPKEYWVTDSINTTASGVVSTVPTFTALGVYTKLPLSSFLNEFWDDQVYVSYVSNIGPALTQILTFLITTYTTYTYNLSGIGAAGGFSCSFATVEQKDIMTQIKEICFQCNVAVWLSEGVFHFLYLPGTPSAVSSIGLSDVIAETLEIGITTTENIITKIKAAWFFTYELDTRNYYSARYNDFRYGMHELDVDYYCFQDMNTIAASVLFWLYRKGNTWKRLKFSLPLAYVTLNIFDVVTLNADVVNLYQLGTHGQSVKASVVGLSINTDTFLLDIELELPIYVGSMKNSPAYWLQNYSGFFYQIDEAFGLTETPQQTIAYQRGASIANATATNELLLEEATQFGGGGGFGYGVSQPDPVGGDSTPQNLSIFTRTDSGIQMNSIGGSSGGGIQPQNQTIQPQYPPPRFNYAYADFPTTQSSGAPSNSGACFPGYVVEKGQDQSNIPSIQTVTSDGNITSDTQVMYSCNVFTSGLSKSPVLVDAVLLQDTINDADIPSGTWALFSVVQAPAQSDSSSSSIFADTSNVVGSNVASTNADGNFYFFQVPIWMG